MSNIGILTVPPLLEVFTSGDNLNLLLVQVLFLKKCNSFWYSALYLNSSRVFGRHDIWTNEEVMKSSSAIGLMATISGWTEVK